MNFDTQTIIVIVIVLMIGIAMGYIIGLKFCGSKCQSPKDSEIISNGNLKSIKVSGTLQTGDSVEGGVDVESRVEGGDITCFGGNGLEIVAVTVRDPYNQLAVMTLEPVYFEGGAPPKGLTKEQKEMIKTALKFVINTMFKLIYDQESLQYMAEALLKKNIKLPKQNEPISRAMQFDMIAGFRNAKYGSGLMTKVMEVFKEETDMTEIVLKLVSVIRGAVFTGVKGLGSMISWLRGVNQMFSDLYNNKDKFSATMLITILLTGLISVIMKSFNKRVKAFAMWFKQTTPAEITAFSSLMLFIENMINTTLGVSSKIASKVKKDSSVAERIDALKVGIGNWDWGVLFRELIPELLTVCTSATQAENIISAILTKNSQVILPSDKLRQICANLRKSGADDGDGMEFIFDPDAGENANETVVEVPAAPKAEGISMDLDDAAKKEVAASTVTNTVANKQSKDKNNVTVNDLNTNERSANRPTKMYGADMYASEW